jgi:methionine synthase II (cobalamin-independent)
MAVTHRFSADHLGPLAAPPALASQPSAEELDAAIVGLLELQRDAWISLATDGELRRRYGLGGVSRLDEMRFVAARSGMSRKLRIPRAGAGAAIADADELTALAAAGASYLQLDGCAYAPLLRRASREALRTAGRDPERELARLLEQDCAVLSRVRRDAAVRIAVAFHDVDDTGAAPFAFDLEPAAAERALHGLPVDRFLFDCGGVDEASDCGFLALLPAGAEAVLGMIDAAAGHLPDADDIVRRIDIAAQVIDTDRLALSPRFGLAAALAPMAPQAAWERQARVLDLLMDASSRAWGLEV